MIVATPPAAPRFPFGKERRLRKRADFLRVQSIGLRATAKHFVLLVAAGPDGKAPSRIGIVATKKVGDATQRNRIKRMCRECFRLWPDFLPNGIDLVVIAREGTDELTRDEVQKEWERARSSVLSRCKEALAAGYSAAPPPRVENAPAPPGRPRRNEPGRKEAPSRAKSR